MYRDEQEAALRRAEALEREVRDLRATVRAHSEVVARLEALEQELAERREHNAADAQRILSLQKRLDILRFDLAGAPPPRVHDLATGILTAPRSPRRAGAAAALALLGLLAVAGAGALFALGGRCGTGSWAVSGAGSVPVSVIDERPDVWSGEDEDFPLDWSRLSPAERARRLYERGTRLRDAGRVAAAREVFVSAVATDETLPGPHRELARLAFERGETHRGCAELARYLDLAPDADALEGVRAELAARCSRE